MHARLDLVVLPWASADQQMQLMLAGDEKIDMFYDDGTNAVRYMNSGQIIDMTDLVNTYGKNVKELYGDEVLQYNTVDGFMYGTPNQIERGSIPAVYIWRVYKYIFITKESRRGEKITKPEHTAD